MTLCKWSDSYFYFRHSAAQTIIPRASHSLIMYTHSPSPTTEYGSGITKYWRRMVLWQKLVRIQYTKFLLVRSINWLNFRIDGVDWKTLFWLSEYWLWLIFLLVDHSHPAYRFKVYATHEQSYFWITDQLFLVLIGFHFFFLGPRFVLNPIRVFEGSFGGSTLYQNPNYVSPNDVSDVVDKTYKP